jgi:hypothetical protein
MLKRMTKYLLEIVNQSESTVRNGKIVAYSAQRAP